MRKASVATILQKAKQNLQLTPKSKQRRGGGRARRSRHSRDDSESSSASSFDESSAYSDISESDYSSSYSEESKLERYSHNRQDEGRRHHRAKGSKRHNERGRRRDRRRRDRDRYSPDPYAEYTPQRHLKNPNALEDDAAQMIDLLMRILPFYGKGDGNSDAVVIDTIHRLPPHALEMQDMDGNTLLLLASQAGAYDLMPTLLSKGCNVNIRNNVGASCLHFACFVDTFAPDAAMVLVRHGAVAEIAEHEYGCTPLHWAAYSGHAELCATLCRAGANPKTLDKNGCDPIRYSKQNGHTACAQLLESFAAAKKIGSPSSAARTGAANTSSPDAHKREWVRCLDGSSGSSFYHNKDTGESLWGDDFRKMDQADEPPVPDKKINPPEKKESKQAENEIKKDGVDHKEQQSPITSNEVSELQDIVPKTNASKLAPSGEEIDRGTSQQVPLHDASDALPHPEKGINDTKNKKLTAIAEDHETSSHEKAEPDLNTCQDIPISEPLPEKESQLADIVEGLEETSSIEDDEPTETNGNPPTIESTERRINDKKPSLSRLNSWDADFDAEGKKYPVNGKKDTDPTEPMLARNQSFEARISSLHQKIESQFMHRLQHLEHKIAKQNLETSTKVEDDSSKLKENVAEMASTILQLRTESGTKDLEILSLKQQIVKLETEKISELKGSMNVCFGDGNVHEDIMQIENEELSAAKARYEQELKGAHDEISQLKDRVDETTNSLNVANSRYAQAQRHLEIAEQTARDEKASRSSMKNPSEQAGNGLGSTPLQEENDLAQETILKLKKQIQMMECKTLDEDNGHNQERESLNKKIVEEQCLAEQSRAEVERITTMYQASLSEANDRYQEELEQVKEELNDTSSQLGNMQEQLREAKMVRMELMLAKDEAVDEMESALEKARSAEGKMREMSERVKETETLKKTNEQLHLSLQKETEKRKVLHNTIEDMKGRIRVYVRVRPLSKTEVKANYVNVMKKEDDRTCVMAGDAATATDVRDWEFDKIFYGSEADGNTQENVFRDTSLLITSAIDGFNVCIFAYGQTGSGKTYTMLGSADGDDETHQGLAPRIAHELFRKLSERESSYHIEVSASMLEIYTDKLRDLLASGKHESLEDLKIRLAEHTSSGLVEVDGAKIEPVANAKELLGVIDRGTKGRASSSTKMNAESSRSHMIASIVLSLCNRRTGKIVYGKLTLVDLAGSERVSKSGATGHQLKEAQSINKSLSALGDVIGSLTSGCRQHIPYRNHPLTMLMSDSIGGNAKTLMFVCCSPADYNRKESANSLDFAKRCRNVKNNAVASKGKGSSTDQASTIKALRQELSKIKEREKAGGTVKRRPMRRPGM